MLLLYGSAAIGATLHIHYCMNKVTGISLATNKNTACNTCGMPKTKAHGCCREECKQLKLSADQQLNQAYTSDDIFLPAVITPVASVAEAKLTTTILVEKICHAPPGLSRQKLYIKNNVWLI